MAAKPTAPTRRLNVRAAIILGIIALVGIPAFFGAWAIQTQSTRSRLLAQAKTLARKEPRQLDLALSYVNEFLNRNPHSAEGLALKSEILGETAASAEDFQAAITVGEQALRRETEPGERQALRRRLVRFYRRQARLLPPSLVPYRIAAGLADELVGGERVEDNSQKRLDGTRNQDAEAYRLLAWALEGQSAEGAGDEKTLQDAITYYEKARKLEPGDVAGAHDLARLYSVRAKQPKKALAVLDALLAANPSAEAHLARHDYFVNLAKDNDKAAADLAAAVKLKPADRDIRLTAAYDALRRNQIATARRHIEAIPEANRDHPRVRLAQGIIELSESHLEEAIDNWRQGLLLEGGTNVDLTWRLAFVELSLGRTDEAAPLIEQFRRLVGPKAPGVRYLDALRDLKENHPVKAIQALEKLRLTLDRPDLAMQVDVALGQAYEAVRDDEQALEAYTRAMQAAPKAAGPRVARLRLIQSLRPEQADAELRRGLVDTPDDPYLLLALARAELLKQAGKRADKRDWTALADYLKRAREAAPNFGALALVEADFRALDARALSDYWAKAGPLKSPTEILEAAIKHDPKNVEVWTAYAGRLAQRGDFEQALLALERASAPDKVGDQAAMRINRARILVRQGHLQEAREILLRDVDRLPPGQRPLIYSELGDLDTTQRKYAEARKAYVRWAELQPDDPRPWLFLMDRALADNDTAEADRCITALDQIGAVQGLYAKIARAERVLRDPPAAAAESTADRDRRLGLAEDLVEEILRIAPKQRYGFLLKGQLMLARGKLDEAIRAYEDSLDYGGGQTALEHLVELYTRRRDDPALARLRDRHPEMAAAQDRLAAQVALRDGQNDKARALAAKVVAAEPDSLDTRVWHAQLLIALGDPKAAETTLSELAAAHPDDWGPLNALLTFYVDRKEPRAAARIIETIKARVKTDRPELLWAQCYRKAGDLAQAGALYKQARARWPGDPLVARSAAEFLEATGQTEETEACLRDVVSRDPKQRWAVRWLVLLLSARRGLDPAAWTEARRLIGEPTPGDATEDRLVRAIVLARSASAADRSGAIGQLETLLADLPHDIAAAATARKLLNDLYIETNQPERARALAEAEAAGGRDPAALTALVQTLIRDKLWDEADQQVKRLETLVPGGSLVPGLRARILAGQGKTADAVALLSRYFESQKTGPGGELAGREVLTALSGLNQVEAAERIAAEMARLWPKTAWMLGAIRVTQRRDKEAFDLFQTAAKHGAPEGLDRALERAFRGTEPTRLARADAILDIALKRDPSSVDLLSRRAFLRHLQGRYDEEVALYNEVLKLGPDDFKFLNNMAWTLSESQGKHVEALARINEALDHVGISPQLLDTRGVILTRLGRLDEAIKDLKRAGEIGASSQSFPAIQFHLARALKQAGHRDEARRALEKARASEPYKLTPETLQEPKERDELKALDDSLAANR